MGHLIKGATRKEYALFLASLISSELYSGLGLRAPCEPTSYCRRKIARYSVGGGPPMEQKGHKSGAYTPDGELYSTRHTACPDEGAGDIAARAGLTDFAIPAARGARAGVRMVVPDRRNRSH